MTYIITRLREPSTYAGLGALLGTFGVVMPPGMVQNITLAGTGLAGIVAALLPDR